MKNLTLAAVITAATATVALPAMAATDGFSFQRSVESAGHVELQQVRSEGAGRVEIFDGFSGANSVLLGTEDVRAGLETDVRVNLAHKPYRNYVTAVLYNAAGDVTATQRLRVTK